MDVASGISRRFTVTPGPEICPIWRPDGRAILFSDVVPGGFALYVKSSLTDAAATPLVKDTALRAIGMDYSRDGRYVLYRSNVPSNQWDIWTASTDGAAPPIAVAQSPFDERSAQFSPDARWIAYESNESGQYEIYVRPFPGPGTGTRVSTNGGAQPRWRRNGSELFYISPDSRLMSVPMAFPSRDTIRPGTPVPLFSVRVTSTVHGGTAFEYDVSADGQRFLVNTMVERPTAPISLILNRRSRP
jgi:Tol biopolymer transport system component